MHFFSFFSSCMYAIMLEIFAVDVFVVLRDT